MARKVNHISGRLEKQRSLGICFVGAKEAVQLGLVHLSLALAGLSGTTLFRVPLGRGVPISSYWLVRVVWLILLGVLIRRSLVFTNTGDLMDIVRPFLGAETGMNPGSGGGQPSDSFIPPFVQEDPNRDRDAGSPAWETFDPILELPTIETEQGQPSQGDVGLEAGKTKEQIAWERALAKEEISGYRDAIVVEFEKTRKRTGSLTRERWKLAMNSLLEGQSPDVWYQKLQECINLQKESPIYKEVHNWFMERKKENE